MATIIAVLIIIFITYATVVPFVLILFVSLSLNPQTNNLIESHFSNSKHSFSFPANFQIPQTNMAAVFFYPSFLFIIIIIIFFIIPHSFADNLNNYITNDNNKNNIISNPSPAPSLQRTRLNSSLFEPTTAVFVFVAVLSILFCIIFLLLLYSKRCAGESSYDNPYIYTHHPSSLVSASAGRNSGINRVVVESLPLFRFSSLSGLKDGLECAVCLTRFEPNELLRLLPKCKHAFHAECVDTWLDAHSTCPLCRYRVDPEDILLIQDQHLSLTIPATSSNRYETTEPEPYRTRRVSGRHSYAGERVTTSGIKTTWFRRSTDSSGGATTTGGSNNRKDGLLLSLREEERKRLEHRIIVSGSGDGQGGGSGKGSGFHQRWSDVQPSDLLYLRSEMIISQSRRLRVGSLVAEADAEAETGNNNNNKNNVEKDGNGKEEGKNGVEHW